MSDRLQDLLRSFRAFADPGAFGVPDSHLHEGGEHDTLVVFSSMIHGDEVGSLPGLLRAVEELATGTLSFGGRAAFVVGNAEAGGHGVRFLDSDLNRVFVTEPPDDREGRRARALMPLFDAADVYFDFHQTILASDQPFYICPFQMHGWRWARAVAGAKVWVTRHPGQAFSSGTMCADEYVRNLGRPGITLELGEKGFTDLAEERTHRTIHRVLALLDAIARGETTLQAAAEAQPELEFFHTVHREPFASMDHALKPDVINFQPVAEGERLSADGAPEMVATTDGVVLFPKYPPRREDGAYKKPLPKEIYRIVQKLPAHPLEQYADVIPSLPTE